MNTFFIFMQIKPIIEKVFNFNQVGEAFEHLESGHARGKTVINQDID